MNPIYASRRRNDFIIRTLCFGAALFGVTWLALILFTLFYNGLAGLSLQLFTDNTPPPGSTEGGLLNAITGSIFSPGTTISAAIASEFAESDGLHQSALILLGLLLFVLTFFVLSAARLMLMRLETKAGK